jgi:F-type H+-transporting ATPase subunit alpha
MAVLEKGRRNVEILKQPQYSPMRVEHQIAIIYCGTNNLLKDVPVNKIIEFESEFLHHMDSNYADTLKLLAQGKLTDEVKADIEKAAAEVAKRFKE